LPQLRRQGSVSGVQKQRRIAEDSIVLKKQMRMSAKLQAFKRRMNDRHIEWLQLLVPVADAALRGEEVQYIPPDNPAHLFESFKLACCDEQFTKVAQWLVQSKRVDQFLKMDNGSSILHEATRFNRLQVAAVLLDHGADINAKLEVKNKDLEAGTTPLHLAAFEDHQKMLQLLVERGADKNSKDARGRTPLLWVAEGNTAYGKQKQKVEKATKDRNRVQNRWQPASEEQFQSEGRAVRATELLLLLGANIEARDERLRTPLLAAAAAGRAVLVKVLLQNGADIMASDWNHQTALHLAAHNNHLSTCTHTPYPPRTYHVNHLTTHVRFCHNNNLFMHA